MISELSDTRDIYSVYDRTKESRMNDRCFVGLYKRRFGIILKHRS